MSDQHLQNQYVCPLPLCGDTNIYLTAAQKTLMKCCILVNMSCMPMELEVMGCTLTRKLSQFTVNDGQQSNRNFVRLVTSMLGTFSCIVNPALLLKFTKEFICKSFISNLGNIKKNMCSSNNSVYN